MKKAIVLGNPVEYGDYTYVSVYMEGDTEYFGDEINYPDRHMIVGSSWTDWGYYKRLYYGIIQFDIPPKETKKVLLHIYAEPHYIQYWNAKAYTIRASPDLTTLSWNRFKQLQITEPETFWLPLAPGQWQTWNLTPYVNEAIRRGYMRPTVLIKFIQTFGVPSAWSYQYYRTKYYNNPDYWPWAEVEY